MKARHLAVAGLSAWALSAYAQPTTIVWSYWGDPGELPPFQEIIKSFEASHPNIKIQVQHAPWSGYWTRLDAQLAAKEGPDVMFITNVPTYASRGVLEPLDSYLAKSKVDWTQYNQDLLGIFKYGGKIYGYPRDNDTTVLYYNKDAFDAAGVDYPNDKWRWADLVAAAQKLTKRQGERVVQYGIALEDNKWPIFVYQNGASAFDDPVNATRFTLNTPKGIEAIQFIGDLINKYKVAPSFQSMAQIGSTTQLFMSGQAAMTMTNAARLGTFKDAKFKWAVAPLPAGPSGIRANSGGGAGFAMNAYSKHKAEAWQFLEYVMGPEGQAIFAKSGTAVPAMSKNPAVRAAFNVPFKEVFLDETANAKLLYFFPKYVRIRDTLLQPALDLVWNGQAQAKDVINQALADKINAVLREK
ncbi:MAG: sugar ABC transporter substrate-binding protein [Meiothermus silvanus]|nr:sugar ABC transporter substrate-binding protein [Allomeiothermus silvanus]